MAKPRKRNQTLTVRLTEAGEGAHPDPGQESPAQRHRLPGGPVLGDAHLPGAGHPSPAGGAETHGQQREPNRPEGKRWGFHLLQLPGGGGPAGRVARSAVPPYQEQPMATVMYIPEKKQSLGAMKGVMELRLPGEKDQGPGHRPAVCHRRPLPGGQCLPGISGHQAHLWQDEGHELLPVRAILLPKGGGDIGEGPRHRFGVCPKSLAGLRGVGGHSPGRRAPPFPLCGELRQLGDGSEAAAIPQDLADPPGPER